MKTSITYKDNCSEFYEIEQRLYSILSANAINTSILDSYEGDKYEVNNSLITLTDDFKEYLKKHISISIIIKALEMLKTSIPSGLEKSLDKYNKNNKNLSYNDLESHFDSFNGSTNDDESNLYNAYVKYFRRVSKVSKIIEELKGFPLSEIDISKVLKDIETSIGENFRDKLRKELSNINLDITSILKQSDFSEEIESEVGNVRDLSDIIISKFNFQYILLFVLLGSLFSASSSFLTKEFEDKYKGLLSSLFISALQLVGGDENEKESESDLSKSFLTKEFEDKYVGLLTDQLDLNIDNMINSGVVVGSKNNPLVLGNNIAIIYNNSGYDGELVLKGFETGKKEDKLIRIYNFTYRVKSGLEENAYYNLPYSYPVNLDKINQVKVNPLMDLYGSDNLSIVE